MNMKEPYQQQNFPLYEPRNEHDACGIGFIVNINGKRSHDIVTKGIEILINLTHRGASGCDPETGDGAGITIQIPHKFFAKECKKTGIILPDEGEYGIGMVFLPVTQSSRLVCEGIIERIVREEGLSVLGWRDTPVGADAIGRIARASQPYIEQIFIRRAEGMTREEFDRKLYVVRKCVEVELYSSNIKEKDFFYIPSLSSRVIVYKGLLLAPQIAQFYVDLLDPDTESQLCLVHQRFSTNTLPNWQLAHPFRFVSHNGEINTMRGNVSWMCARQSVLKSDLFGDDFKKLIPIISPNGSDSAALDNAVEMLYHAGRSLPHVMAMLIPEAWNHDVTMSPEKKAFFEYHASLMEPWDGPAAVAFTDGKIIGATLDRNGLRPVRYIETHDGLLIMASEVGVLPIEPERVKVKGRLEPGKILFVDLEQKRVLFDDEIKSQLSALQPYGAWIKENQLTLEQLAEPPRAHMLSEKDIVQRQRMFGYSDEDLRMIITPMVVNGEEAIGSMGADTPLACLSDKPQSLFSYFKQLFAQVTNPPIDPIREEFIMSLTSYIGTERNILAETPLHCHTLKLQHPILYNTELEKLRRVSQGDFLTTTLPMLFRVNGGEPELERALAGLCRRSSLAIESGYSIIILSDRGSDEEYAPIPSLLALTAVHNHLVREKTRTQVALVVESGEPREVMHYCLLIGYGASAVNPYLAIETIEYLANKGRLPKDIATKDALRNYKKAVGKGLLKVFSKMGISTLQSYRGAQIFEVIGLNKKVVEKYFHGTASRIEGIGLDVLVEEARRKHQFAFQPLLEVDTELELGGNYHFRISGERHLINPETVIKLQQSVRKKDFKTFKEYTSLLNDQNKEFFTLRGLMEFKEGTRSVPLDEVEPVEQIVKRFVTGAMSFGSISKEAHETIAIAMNRIGGKSNTGEGGEDEARFSADANGDLRRSAIKQVASGRFGVTTNFLVNADEIQIKMAQGAKPGEGGQLPGFKVDEVIAKTRHSIAGVGLISPPPHHDIYSIEDLGQLIYDLKNVNPTARISVKLVSEVGVGTVAAGVAKAHADIILISGDCGGTGASPLTSIKHAGIPWELGLAETQQTLVMNDLRSRVRLQTDGKIQTGRDVVVAALLGAEEFGFSTAPLISMGCLMMRKCHLNTCPVGIATQNPELRKKFTGTPEHVINFFFFIANEVREIMAKLGFRTVDEMIGRVDILQQRKDIDHWKAKGIDLSSILHRPTVPLRIGQRWMIPQDHGIHEALDNQIIEKTKEALEEKKSIELSLPIRSVHRTAGALLSGRIAKSYGAEGLPDNTIKIYFTGSAGQSFGAFLSKGVTLTLEGDANDYVGKGLSGGRIIIYPPKNSSFVPEDNSIVGNVVLYGATSGEAYFSGKAGERFAVRNSGATVVVESVGANGCEYMTNGIVVVLGKAGKNFAAGMSGGHAFVLDENGEFDLKMCNKTMVDLERLKDEDERLVQNLIKKHIELTGSKRGQKILDDWKVFGEKFVKVFPHDYKRVLNSTKQKSKEQAEVVKISDSVKEVANG
ncbi:MAG: glutamate synthase large subunit [Candidatus Riflebacteria bacterium]|nr:glutamate synthase large subunit [Candidatus Riflebacteria bacterium]